MKKKYIVLTAILVVSVLLVLVVLSEKEKMAQYTEAMFLRVWNSHRAEQADIEEKAIVSPVWDYYSRIETGMPMGTDSFSVGAAECLFNSARFAEDTAENKVELFDSFSHVGTLVVDENGIGYCVASYNPAHNGDSPSIETLQTQLCLIDIETMEKRGTFTVAKNGDTLCDGKKIVSGAGDPNEVLIDGNTVRIVFTAKLSDGDWYELYRDFDTNNSTLGEIDYCFLEVNGITMPFSNASVNQLLFNNEQVANGNLAFQGQATNFEGEYYICVACLSYIKNGEILKTNDFITFHHWLMPEIQNNNVNHEAACYIFADDLFVAFRQADRDRLLIARIDLDTKQILSTFECNDARSRMCWFENNGVLYLAHSTNDRNNVNLERIEINSLKLSTTVCQGYSFIYPSILIYNNEGLILYSRNQKVNISKFVPVPYNRNNTIAVVNKLLDLYGND